tara:strand:+ start:423 stop:542 length:120 start_codon:yes stop_codon:yes gene_type:complete
MLLDATYSDIDETTMFVPYGVNHGTYLWNMLARIFRKAD